MTLPLHGSRTVLLTVLGALALVLGLAPAAALAASEQVQSVPVYCQSAVAGSTYGGEVTALSGQYVAANAYVLQFGATSAQLTTSGGTVIASVALAPLVTWTPPAAQLLYPSPAAGAYLQDQGLPGAQLQILAGSSLGVGPYGVTGCVLSASGDATSSATFAVAATPAIVAGTPLISGPLTGNGAIIAATVGSPISYQITASNQPTSYASSSIDLTSALPAGLSLNAATGLISGTPAAGSGGSYLMVFQAANAVGLGTAPAVLNIAPSAGSPVITSSVSTVASAGAGFTYAITASGGATSYGASPLPGGVTINPSSGVLSGAPTLPGAYETLITATNASGTGSSQVLISIAPNPNAPAITSVGSATGTVGDFFSFQIGASKGPTSYGLQGYGVALSVAEESLPPGLSFDTSAGVVSGTPTTTGITTIAIFAANGSGSGAIAPFTIAIGSAGGAPAISSAASASGAVGSAFSYQVTAPGATAYGLSGQPPGLSINATTGAITGTPTVAGTAVATITASNSSGTGAATLSIAISGGGSGAAPGITSALDVATVTGTAYSYQIIASSTPTSYAASLLPLGLTLNAATGVISGTPQIAGVAYSTISATNSAGTGSAVVTWNLISGGGETTSTTATSGSGTTGTGTSATTTAGTGGQSTYDGNTNSCGLGGSGAGLILAALLGLRLGRSQRRAPRG